MSVDPEIKELKELVRNQTALIEDTNRIVHKMRSAARWSLTIQLIWWFSIVGLSSALYFVYLAPYMEQIMGLYTGAQNILENFRPGQ